MKWIILTAVVVFGLFVLGWFYATAKQNGHDGGQLNLQEVASPANGALFR